MHEEKVVLVDKNDNKLGLMPKMEAHLGFTNPTWIYSKSKS